MSPFALDLERTRTNISLVELEPALNAFGSMLLLSYKETDPGIHEWIAKTRAQMSTEEQARHFLVMIGFHYAILPAKSGLSFDAYLTDLEATPPSVLRERLLTAYAGMCKTGGHQQDISQDVNWEDVLSSTENYVEFLRARFGDEAVDPDMEAR